MDIEQPTQHCRNCGFPLPEGARYCPQCSQKNHDGRLSFREMVSETIATIFNLDNRIFNTLKTLAVPGKLTVDYFAGKHVRYYHPVRLFLVAGALFIAALSVQIGDGPSQIMPKSYNEIKELHQKHQFYLQLDSLKKSVAATLNDRRAIAALDTLFSKLDSSYVTSANDSLTFAKSFIHDGTKDTLYNGGNFNISLQESDQVNIAVEDLDNMKEDSLLEAYGITGFMQKLLVRQQIKLQKKGDNFVFYLLGNVLWMMLFMMPMLALILKLIYFRRHYLYYEHLIFSFHVHSFQFLLLAFVIFIGGWLDTKLGPAMSIALITVCFYPLFAMKRFYGQGWIKTILKNILTGIIYLTIFVFAVFGLAFVSFALF